MAGKGNRDTIHSEKVFSIKRRIENDDDDDDEENSALNMHPSVVCVAYLLSASMLGDTLSFIVRHSVRQNNKELLTNQHSQTINRIVFPSSCINTSRQ